MIKAVLFDYGGVLTEAGKAGSIAQAFGKIYGIDEADVRLNPLGDKLLRGNISTDAFFEEMNRRHPGSARATKELFNEHEAAFTARAEPVYALAATLRKAGLRTGILSNVFAMSANDLRQHGNYDGFDPVVLSCDEGLIKPAPEFYEHALAKLRLAPNEVLFIDDQMKCLLPAHTLGMHTILAESPEQIVADTHKLLKTENNLEL